MAGQSDGEQSGGCVEVTVNRQSVTLPAGRISGLELKQEAVAQGVAVQLCFHLWMQRGDRYLAVYDEDVVGVAEDQQYVAVTADEHGWLLPGWPTELASALTTAFGLQQAANPAAMHSPAQGWRLVLPPQLWADLSHHLLGDGGEHAAVLLADHTHDDHGRRLHAQALIPAVDNIDYIQGDIAGYRSLAPEFIRDTAIRARDEQRAYLAVHNHQHGTGQLGFSHIDLASHQRGYRALCQLSGQPVGALVLTPHTTAGHLWLPDRTTHPLTGIIRRSRTVMTTPPYDRGYDDSADGARRRRCRRP